MIYEDYVNFETAKLLKENGFNAEIDTYYSNEGDLLIWSPNEKKSYLTNDGVETWWWKCIAPSQSMAMKWLRKEHNIDISVVPHSYKEGTTFDYEFVYWNGEEYHTPYSEKYPTYHKLFGKTWKEYEEACEAAIKYCLENLI